MMMHKWKLEKSVSDDDAMNVTWNKETGARSKFGDLSRNQEKSRELREEWEDFKGIITVIVFVSVTRSGLKEDYVFFYLSGSVGD